MNVPSAQATKRVAIIGIGRWGQTLLKNLIRDTRFRITHLGTRYPHHAELVPYPVKTTPDWQDILQEGCDGLFIATPPKTHRSIAQAALEQGIAVWVEKPLCTTLADALAIRETAQRSRATVFVDHIHLFNPYYHALKKRLQQLGEPITRILSEGMAFGPFRSHTNALWDWGPHDVSLCLDLMGKEPTTIAATGIDFPDNHDEHFNLELSFANGCRTWHSFGRLGAQKRRTLQVYTPHHRLIWTEGATHGESALAEQPFSWSERNEKEIAAWTNLPPASAQTPLESALEAFLSIINGQPHPLAGVDLAVSVTRVLSQAEASLRQHPEG
jgi:predicted dehydrogenase